jgi:hypothetical protein
MSLRRRLAIASALVLSTLATLAPSAAAAGPPAFQPVVRQAVKLPPEVTQAYMPQWAPDGKHLVFVFAAGSAAAQLGISNPNGSGFHCLTCGTEKLVGSDTSYGPGNELAMGKQFPFPDGKRILSALPGSGGDTANFGFSVVECLPSIYDCRSHTTTAIELPRSLPEPVQNREGRLSPDGRFFAWTEVDAEHGPVMAIGKLEKGPERYEVADARSLNPAFTLDEHPEGWALGAPQYEFKRFAFDGHTVTYAAEASALNYDTFTIDLRNGNRRRLTKDPEWDEDVQFSPNGRKLLQYSSHGLDRISPFSQLPRPPFIDFASFVQVGRYTLQTLAQKGCMQEPWLMGAKGQQGAYYGQPLNALISSGWRSSTIFGWNPDGRRIVFGEQRIPQVTDPSVRSRRLVVVKLPGEKAQPVRPPKHWVFPNWAPPLAGWEGLAGHQVVNQTVHGTKSGTATINYAGYYAAGSFSVSFDNYSEDGKHIVNGTESLTTELATNGGRYVAHLTLSGAETGSLDAELDLTKDSASGPFQSTLNGKTKGLPSPRPCADLKAPLRLKLLRARAAHGGKARIWVRVEAKVFADKAWRPVRYAGVRAGGRFARTNGAGRASLLIPARATEVEASAAGFKAAGVRWRPR